MTGKVLAEVRGGALQLMKEVEDPGGLLAASAVHGCPLTVTVTALTESGWPATAPRPTPRAVMLMVPPRPMGSTGGSTDTMIRFSEGQTGGKGEGPAREGRGSG